MDTNNIKRKILIFSTAYQPFIGGAEVAIREITNRFSSDFSFDMITARFDRKLPVYEKVGNIGVYRVGIGSKLDKLLLPVLGSIKAYKMTKSDQYSCFWSMMVSYSSIAGYFCNLFRAISFKKKIPVVLTLQEGDSESHLNYKWGGMIALFWFILLKSTNHLTAISNFLLDRAVKKGFKGKKSLIPNGVDMDIFSRDISAEETNDIKNKLNKKEGDVFLVTTGRLTYKNGLDTVIKSLEHLPNRFHFIVIGRGEKGPELQDLAKSLGVSNRVKFLGFIPYADIPKYFSACDIFVRPSRSEGFGNSFIEAMAFGLPVIATPVGGIVDFLSDKETGIFCYPENPKSIIRAIESIIPDTSLRDNMIKNAYKKVKSEYDWDLIAPRMTMVFNSLIQK